MNRHEDLIRFYSILHQLELKLGGTRMLDQGKVGFECPIRGVYFFFEPGEVRRDSGKGLRVVRVGTHAVSSGSRTTLWNRLGTHRGSVKTGGGSHRASVFRARIGDALANRSPQLKRETWGLGSSAPRAIRDAEYELELAVSLEIRQMPFLWLPVDDVPSRLSTRSYLERKSIALLSNLHRPPIDPPGQSWLGLYSTYPEIRESGLWNSNYVDRDYDPAFLDALASKVCDV